ncbi:MAG: 2-succinylbenzoate--CoA ligase [Phycisphaerae bacterium]|nr:2-succinylbenzoate--CoA ligase [Phycisphaerae bacterium]
MLFELLMNLAKHNGGCEAVARGAAIATFDTLAARASALAAAWAAMAGRPVGLALSDGSEWIASAAALDRLGCRAYLLSSQSAEDIVALADRFGLACIVCEPEAAESAGDPRLVTPPPSVPGAAPRDLPANAPSEVVLFTSGTTGEPKAALHTWASLTSGIRPRPELAGVRMLLAYECTRYAGLQVLLTGLIGRARLTVPTSRDMGDIIDAIVRDRVEFVSGTPTFWRMLLVRSSDGQRRRMPLRQITLGGEAARQPILDALRREFPDARITQIYASTEMGVCFSVHDAREGLPASLLNRDDLPVAMKVENGRLMIRSSRSMRQYLDDQPVAGRWFDTGDSVEVRGDRVLFLGRESTRINVGGDKVYPEEIEAVLRGVEGVAEVRVSGVDSSIVGQLVQADVLPMPGADRAALRERIDFACRQLAGHKRPRIINLVDTLATGGSMKLRRGG